MVRAPSKRLLERIARAAGLRAAGNSWEGVGRVLGCRAETCRGWETRYPASWLYLYGRTQEELYRQMWVAVERELRALLRSTDRRMRVRAAELVLRAARDHPGSVSARVVVEAGMVQESEAAGRVRVVRVTANGPPVIEGS